jgi:hypothetical protein
VEQIRWCALPADDPDYIALDELKEQANDGEGEEEDSVNKDRQLAKALSAYHEEDKTWREIEAEPWAEFSREWYRTRASDLSRVKA